LQLIEVCGPFDSFGLAQGAENSHLSWKSLFLVADMHEPHG
jgi:hypothetical protein